MDVDSDADLRKANAVARHENLEFLTDVVPRTTTYKAFKEKQTKSAVSNTNGSHVEAVTALSNDTSAEQALPVDEMDVDEVGGSSAPAQINGATTEQGPTIS